MTTAALQRSTTNPTHSGADAAAYPQRTYKRPPQSRRSRPENRAAVRKLAPGFLSKKAAPRARSVALQVTETHQENSVFFCTIALGCAVAPNNPAGPVVTNPNGETNPTTPGVSDNFHPRVGGLRNGQVLNQNEYFEKRWPGWTKEMVQRAYVAGMSQALKGNTGGLDGNVLLTPQTSAVYGDKLMSFREANFVTGSFTYVIDRVNAQTNSSGAIEWSAQIRVVDSVGFDNRDWQGRTPGLREAFPERIVTRATWNVSGSINGM